MTSPEWASGKAPLTVSFGGGLNSTALLILLDESGIRPDLVMFADTGGEKPETYTHVRRVAKWMKRVHFPDLVIVKYASPRAGYASLEDACLKTRTLPSRAFGYSSCADKWKIRPLNRNLRKWLFYNGQLGKAKPWRLLGYDGGETRRASITEDDRCRYAYPLLDWSLRRAKCAEVCARAGFPKIIKSACFFCPSSTKDDVLYLKETHPDLFERAIVMEKQAKDAGNLTQIKGLGRKWAWQSLADASEQDRALFCEQPVESCTMCADEGEDD